MVTAVVVACINLATATFRWHLPYNNETEAAVKPDSNTETEKNPDPGPRSWLFAAHAKVLSWKVADDGVTKKWP